jgi:hypothetical protein
MTDTPKATARIKPGETWRDRAGSIVLDPNDPNGIPLPTPADRRWLWRIENALAVLATNDGLRQLGLDLRAYLAETCEHHMRHSGEGDAPEYGQCLWCSEVVFEGDAANEAARAAVAILGIGDAAP